MNKSLLKTFALCAAAACVLSACGGGDDPDPTTRNAILTVSAASDASLNGVYSSSNISLSDVQTIVRAGATDACEFTYDNLRKTTDNAVTVQGRIRYIKDATTLNEYSLSINGASFARADGVGTSVDRANSQIVFSGSVPTSATGTGTITITGNIPLQFSRPSGC